MRYALVLSVVLLAGCGGSSSPPAVDWIVGNWQMYECEDIATGERVAAETLGVSGGFTFTYHNRWQAWREGWPEGRVEGNGEWEFVPPDIYKLTMEDWSAAIYRFGDEWCSLGYFGARAYKFWYRRVEERHGFFWGQTEPRR